MEKNMSNLTLNERVVKTLEIVEKRGYNLTLKKLSENLLGGKIDIKKLKYNVRSFKNIDFDGVFIATLGNLYLKKCMKRRLTNDKLQPIYLKIAEEYSVDYVKFFPRVRCIMTAGSMATEGLGDDDDIDLNIVVQDGSKYTSYLFAILLSLKYSIKYRKQFNEKYLGLLTKVICISVIWEEHQVLSFTRRDEQIAYELLNVDILYNHTFFNNMLKDNRWLNNWFPQVFQKKHHIQEKMNNVSPKRMKKTLPNIIENISMAIMFFFFKIIRMTRSKNQALQDRMDTVEKVKHPYGLFDVPKKR